MNRSSWFNMHCLASEMFVDSQKNSFFRFPIGYYAKTLFWSDYIWMGGLQKCKQEI